MQPSLRTAEGVLKDQEDLFADWLFDEASPSLLRTPTARFQRLAADPIPAFLICARLWDDATEPGVYSPPFLTIISAPFVSPRGQESFPDATWPSLHHLRPGHWPTPPTPCLFLGAHLGPPTRPSGPDFALRTTLPEYYPGMVFSAQGESISHTLWTILPFLGAPMEAQPWASRDPTTVFPDLFSRGITGDPLPAALDPSQRLCYLPVAFPFAKSARPPGRASLGTGHRGGSFSRVRAGDVAGQRRTHERRSRLASVFP